MQLEAVEHGDGPLVLVAGAGTGKTRTLTSRVAALLERGVRAERVLEYEAVRLFVERARAVQPEFRLTDANAGAVVEICLRLDRLPVAIERAAAHSALLSPLQILERLENRLDLGRI